MNRLVVCALGLLALATVAAAADPPPPRPIFPDDYTPAPCAPSNACLTFTHADMRGAAFTFLGLQLDSKWLEDHGDEMTKAFEPVCRKHATCLGTRSNNFLFCDDVMTPEMRDICQRRFPKESQPDDWQQCEMFMETYALGVDQRAEATWMATLPCVNATPPVEKTKPLIVWIDPPSIPVDYKGYIAINAIDPDTHIPVQANLEIEGQIIYVPANPAGSLQAYYPFKWNVKLVRVKAANGHTELLPPTLTIRTEHYPDLTMRLPIPLPAVKLELMPPPAQLHPGKNILTVFAKDADTGKPVELRVMFGNAVVGASNEPIALTIDRKEKRPEIWVTSLFDRYSDATVVPAEK